MGIKTTIISIVVLSILSIVTGVYMSLTSTIKDQEMIIRNLTLERDDKVVKLQLEKANVITLTESLEKQSQLIEKMRIDAQEQRRKYNEWKKQQDKYNQSVIQQHINMQQLQNKDCQEALKYIEIIKETKYENM